MPPQGAKSRRAGRQRRGVKPTPIVRGPPNRPVADNWLMANRLSVTPALATRLAAWRKQHTDAVKERPEGSA